MSGAPSAELEVEPNPVIEGNTLSVHYRGEEKLMYSIDGGAWQEVPMDAEGNGMIDVPVGAGDVVVSDRKFPSHADAFVQVLGLRS